MPANVAVQVSERVTLGTAILRCRQAEVISGVHVSDRVVGDKAILLFSRWWLKLREQTVLVILIE